jgi:D-amino-acid dehydrogenase
MPWLISFMRHCTSSNVEHLQGGLHSLLQETAERIQHLPLDRTPHGLLQLFTGPDAHERMSSEVRHLEHFGVDVIARDIDDLRNGEPILTDDVQAGLELPHDFGLDPQELWAILTSQALAHGTNWQSSMHVDHLVQHGTHIAIHTAAGTIHADQVVIAAGVWSSKLAKHLDTRLPMIPAKGYSVTLQGCELMPSKPMLLANQFTAVDPLAVGLRMSARFELTSARDRRVNPHRITALINRARGALHLPTSIQQTSPWTGLRPASADGAPYIGRLKRQPNVLVATGHGMLGTSLSLGTADLIRRIVEGHAISAAESRLSPARVH